MAERFDNAGFKATASHLPDAVLITDSEGRITWANRAFKKLCGYNLKELIGKRPGSFLQGHGTDPDTVRAMHRAMENRRYFQTEILNYHKKGHAYWASISVTPFLNPEGELEGHVGIAHDITDKRIEANRMENDVVTIYSALVCECMESADPSVADPFLEPLQLSRTSSAQPKSGEPHRKSRS